MKRNLWGGFLLVATGLVLVHLIGGPSKRNAVGRQVPPVQSLLAFSLSNAPVTLGRTPTHGNTDPRIAAAIRSMVTQAQVGGLDRPAAAMLVKSATSFRDGGQTDAFRRLEQQVGPSLRVFLRPRSGTPVQIKGNPLAKAQPSSGGPDSRNAATARAFLRDNAQLLLLDDPDQELRLTQQQTDELGRTTLRFVQTYQGIPVWPAEVGIHLAPNGDVNVFEGAYEATPAGVESRPVLTAEQAQTKAQGAVLNGNNAAATKPSLVIYAPLDRPPRLGWRLELAVALDLYWSVVIDASDGSTLRTVNLCMEDNVPGSGTDLLGVTVPLNVWQSAATYYLWDASKPMFNPLNGAGVIYTYDALDATQDQIIVNNTLQNLYNVTSTSPTSWGNPNAVSASYNLSQVYDYYRQRFGRNSYNDNGSDLVGVVRMGQLHNAFWHWGFQMMFFGDADRYPGSLDVIGHEVTHGVINSIGSQGVLDYRNQPGALNEAFADILGEMVEARSGGTNDWLMGSQLNSPVRNLADPGAFGQPAKMSQYVVTTSDNGGVHENSGIFEHAYYLLAAGLHGAIGNHDAEAIFYRTLTQYLQPLSQFVDARLACIAAAEDLYGAGSTQSIKTGEAFDAVELYAAPASAAEPTNVNAAVQANDSIFFIREEPSLMGEDLWRFEAAQNDPFTGSDLVTNVKVARPSVTGNGAGAFFCGEDENLYFIQTAGTGFTNFNLSGLVHSVAVSPDGHYAAFVLNAASGVPTNQIVLLDLWSNGTSTVDLVTPVSEGPPLNNISYADSLDFSPDAKFLIYDALSALRSPDGSLHQSWSIYALDTATLQQYSIVPPDQSFQIGNPIFSHTSDRFIAFDAQYTNGNTAILTLDLFQGTLGLVGVSQNGKGYPCFNGDDSFIIYADRDNSAVSGRSIYAQLLTADKMSTNSNRVFWWSDAKLAVIYRRGAYPAVNTAPAVTLTSPTQNATFVSPANVTLNASASDIDGSIARVEFYNGSKLLFTKTTSPYAALVTNVPAGVYRVYARAFDNQGASTTSPPVVFTVLPSVYPGVWNRPGAPGFEFALKLLQPGLYRLEASTNMLEWVPLGSFFCPTNLSYWDQKATNFPRRFYRAVPTP